MIGNNLERCRLFLIKDSVVLVGLSQLREHFKARTWSRITTFLLLPKSCLTAPHPMEIMAAMEDICPLRSNISNSTVFTSKKIINIRERTKIANLQLEKHGLYQPILKLLDAIIYLMLFHWVLFQLLLIYRTSMTTNQG